MNPCSISGCKTGNAITARRRGLFQLLNEDDSDEDPLSRSLVGEPSIQEPTPFEPFNLKHLWRNTPTPEPQTTREQTNTEESFQTTPKLSAPTERFFEALLEQRKPETMTARPTKMADNNEKRTTEIKGGKITPFAGKRETLEKFLETIGLHLILNWVKDDEDKIAFTLTYLEGGDADSWRAVFLKRSVTAGGEPNFGKWNDFLRGLRNSFKLSDKEGDALDEIIWMRQGNTSIEDHVAKFKVLLADSRVTQDSPAALDYFQKSIRVPLLKKILDWDNVPETLPEWYKKALKIDNDYHKVQQIIKRDRPKKEEGKPWWNFWKEKDKNAMDIDVITKVYKTMTDKEKTEPMKKGLCFWCRKGGHLSQDCPEKKGKAMTSQPTATTPAPTPTAPKKMTAKELTAHIQSFMALLNDNEKMEFYDEAEWEGFWFGEPDRRWCLQA